jgi:hypothetical protein
MLVFVVALQSPQVSKDWHRVSALCEQTLRSMCNQTVADFRVILVCNERPQTSFFHPNLEIVEHDFALPDSNSHARMNDKWLKLRHGCVIARQYAPCYVMIADADDFVSRRLAQFCRESPITNGWLFQKGYLYQENSRWLVQQNNFNTLCGTSAIVNCTPEELPSDPKQESKRFAVLNFGHTIIGPEMARRGRPLGELPFAGAIYRVGTGENDSGFDLRNWGSKKTWLRQWLNRVWLSNALRNEFGIA